MMSSSGASAQQQQQQYKLELADAAALPLPLPLPLSLPPSSPSSTSPADRVEWSRATILGFIEDYRRQRVLWDPNTKGYHIKQTKYEALKLLSQKYGTEIRSIRSKIKSLRSSFHREHGKVLNGRSRGVLYQPMWFAYEAIRFILDGERDADVAADDDVKPASEADDKLALMHSLDLEQLTSAATATATATADKQKVEQQQQQQHEEFAARVAAAVAAVAAAAAAANGQRDAASDANSNGGCAGDGNGDASTSAEEEADAEAEAEAEAAAAAAAAVSAAVTRSSSDMDGENYCNISAEDVKTEIIEHETELSLLDRQTSTPLSLRYYKATDLTFNPRKRRAQQMDEPDGGVGVGIVGGVLGALTLTPIKSMVQSQPPQGQAQSQQQQQQQQQQQINHSQIAFHAFQQHFSHNLSHNGNGQQQQQQQQQQHQQQQQQHSNNMAQKRDRDRDLSSSPTEANNNNINASNNNHLSTSLETTTTTTTLSNSNSSGISSLLATPSGISGGSSSSHVDEYGVFGEYVAITIRKLKTSKSKIVVKHLINNLLYEAELGKYDQGMPASKEPPQLYKMQ